MVHRQFWIGLLVFITPLMSGMTAEKQPENLIQNGGFEEIKEVDLTTGHFLSAVRGRCDFGSDFIGNVPTNLDQLSGAKKFIVVEGSAGQEVHSGKRALLFDGGFYLRSMFPGTEGDIFDIAYYAKGKSKVSVHFNLVNDQGKFFAQGLPVVYPITVNQTNKWVEVKQTIPIKAEGTKQIFVRLAAEGDICIDDLVIRKRTGIKTRE